MDNELIKKKIFALREEQGLSWADLAAKTGQKSYRNIMNALNSSGLTLRTLERIANALNCKPWQLIQEDTQPATPKPSAILCPYCGKPLTIAKAETAPSNQENTQEQTPSSSPNN